jgi:lysine-specific demethylase/histidyl-hydroxylase NO66
VLSRLISISSDDFATHYWRQQALLSKAADLPAPFDDLLNADSVDELVSERGLRTPFLRVAKAGSTLAEKAFTAGGGVGATVADQVSDDKLVRLFADGATMVLQALHRVWPPIITLCQQLAAELGHPVQANAYVTPPQNQGFSNHYDVHDVFVLQIEGEKQWTIHEPVHQAPLRDQPWTDRRAAVERRARQEPVLETVLRPGDCLYLPRGFLHAAKALGGVSAHLTVGIHVWTRHAIADQLVDQALRQAVADVAVRQSLDLGVTFEDPKTIQHDVDVVRDALVTALQHVTTESLAGALLARDRTTQRAAPIGPLRQWRTAAELEPETMIVLRAHLEASLDRVGGGRIVVRSRAGEVDLTEDEVAPVTRLLQQSAVAAGDLGLDLSRRVVLAGLAVAE